MSCHSIQGKAQGSFTHLTCFPFVWVFLICKGIREVFNLLQDACIKEVIIYSQQATVRNTAISIFNNCILFNPTDYLKVRLRPQNLLKCSFSSIVWALQYTIDPKLFIHKSLSFNGSNSYGLIITKSFIFEGQYIIYSVMHFSRNKLQSNSLS